MIKIGDLVMVVKPMPCCGYSGALGKVCIVVDRHIREMGECVHCGHTEKNVNAVALDDGHVRNIARLIKIDPPSLQDETITEKELTV